MTAFFDRQPLYAPLQPLRRYLPRTGEPPDLDTLNALAAERGIVTGNGAALRFVVPHGSGLPHEERIWWLGEVETRPGNWRDAFNALTWLTFPLGKAALNLRRHRALAGRRHIARPETKRAPSHDALTQFDECGIVLTSADIGIGTGLLRQDETAARRRHGSLPLQRALNEEGVKLFVFGHGSLDLLRDSRIGLCGMATFFHVDGEWLDRPLAAQIADIDGRIAQRLCGDLSSRAGLRNFRMLSLPVFPAMPVSGNA